MITREKALKFLEEKISNRNIIKHLLATEAVMRALAKRLGGNEEEWARAGLLHDGDYCEGVLPGKQGIQITEWLREKGEKIPEAVAQAMAAHNWHNTGVKPKTKMDWALFCSDSLTGLIVAAALVLPNRKLTNLTVKNILNRFQEKSFAKGTRRENIALCQKKLGLSLSELVEICLKAMQKTSKQLGL